MRMESTMKKIMVSMGRGDHNFFWSKLKFSNVTKGEKDGCTWNSSCNEDYIVALTYELLHDQKRKTKKETS